MPAPVADFAELLAPVTPETFFADHFGKKPLHIPAADPAKLAGVMDWEILSEIVSQSRNWVGGETLNLVLDHKPVPPPEYCRMDAGRDGRQTWICDMDKVKAWLRRGASLVLNDIDTLTPGLRAVSDLLEAATGGKCEANLYCSWKAHPAFDTHFDTHDVYALHIAGEKTWRLYQRHVEDPISHPAFKNLPKAFHDKHKGPISQTVTLKPGDVLYFPRGWYHDALASTEATFHITFSVSPMIGLDVLSMLFEGAVQDPLFRRALPRADDKAAVARHLEMLGRQFAEACRQPAVVDQVVDALRRFRVPRGSVTLPADGLARQWRRRGEGVRVANVNGQVVITDGRAGAPIPKEVVEPVRWVLARETFAEAEMAAAFPLFPEPARTKLLRDLAAMSVIQPD